MTLVRHYRGVMLGLLAMAAWWYYSPPEPTLLSFHVGQTFEDVVNHSTYPVLEHSLLPSDQPSQFGAIYVTEPAVIIHFNDPRHGFTLPPTKFAALSFQDNRAVTLATSPMLDKLHFDEAVTVLEDLQKQFKAGGWIPFEVDGSTWFDFSPEGKKRLFAHLLEYDMQTVSLYVPKKYGMTFRLWCASGCMRGEPPYLFMIDVGIGTDTHSWKRGDPEPWEIPSADATKPVSTESYAKSSPTGP